MNKSKLVALVLGLPLSYCAYAQFQKNTKKGEKPMIITSPAFENNDRIPEQFTCEGEDVSPALQWSDVPAGTKTLTIICDDPDAPSKTWVHWVVYNLPAKHNGLAKGADIKQLGGLVGVNDFGKTEYGGPFPPKGHSVHHYHFKLYAVSITLNVLAGATKDVVLQAMQGNVLAEAELIGTYERP